MMTKDEMERGFARGRTLIQEEWADPKEIESVNELIEEGKAKSTAWSYSDKCQCEIRFVTGIVKEN